MLNYFKKKSLFLLVVFVLTAIFFSGPAQASLWDFIRAWVTINPLLVDVSAPAEVEINKTFQVRAGVVNKGEEKIENAKAEIFLPPELVLLKKDPVQEIGVIPPKKEKKISWSVKGEKEGSYVISVSASGELRGEIIKAEDTTMVTVMVIKPSPKGKALEWFQNLFDFFRERLRF